MISDVSLLFILLTLGLAVGAVPVDQDHQGKDKHAVWYEDGVQDCCQSLGLVIRGNHNPRVHSGVVTGEGGLVLKDYFYQNSELRRDVVLPLNDYNISRRRYHS